MKDAGGVRTGWQYREGSAGDLEIYDATGRLLSITNNSGLTQTLAYNALGQLITVTDAFGCSLAFTYDASGRISTMTDPAGGVYTYAYDPVNENLVSVTYPDTKTKTYHYENATFVHVLTGITDENGNRYATWS